jgi:DNA-binding response OmpR family regulator
MRPCVLVVDNEYPGSVSSRKLVLESAKLNVLTAFTADEAINTLARFPNVDAVVIDVQLRGCVCFELIKSLRDLQENVVIITSSPTGQLPCGGEQYHVSNFDPKQLLEALRKISPRRMSYVQQREIEADLSAANS